MKGRRVGVVLSSCLAVLVVSSPSLAYTGGPIRAQLLGYDPTEAKLFYQREDHSETDAPHQIYYFQLMAPEPARPVRAYSLEGTTREHPLNLKDGELRSRWQRLYRRLVPLEGPPDFELTLRVTAQEDGVAEGPDQIARYKLEVTMTTARAQTAIEVASYCSPVVRVQALYGIPGRPERLVMLTYTGRAYGCEEVDQPVLLLEGR